MGSIVEQFRADLSSWLVSLGAGKLSREFFDLVNAIGSARSKQEEAAIIKREAELLLSTINRPESSKHMREFLIRGLYCEMLGYPVPFVYIHALNMTQSPRLLDKRVGYLCTSIFLNENHELLLLLLNSVRKDLDSTNILEVSSAISCMTWLLNKDTVHALLPLVLEKFGSPSEHVRKKAVLLALKCLQKDVSTWNELENPLRSKLCDTDPSVMSATLHCFLHVLRLKHQDPVTYSYIPKLSDLVPSFSGILKQVVDKKLPSHYYYHHVHAPWIQIPLLQILRYIGLLDPSTIVNMTQVLKIILTNPADKMAACAVVYEAILTACHLQVEKAILDLCAKNISFFIGATSTDLNYLGLKLLSEIVKIHPAYASQHQAHVISCLETDDDSIRHKTIDLLFHMTNVRNLPVIIEKMMDRLKKTSDIFMRTELVSKITTLAEKFSNDNYWFVTTMNNVFTIAEHNCPTDVAHKFLRYISEGATDDEEANIELRIHAINTYMEIIQSGVSLSDTFQMVISWVMGEYGYLSQNPTQVINLLVDLLERPPISKSDLTHSQQISNQSRLSSKSSSSSSIANYYGSHVKQWIVVALGKLVAATGTFPIHVRELLQKEARNDNVELARRCLEILTVLNASITGNSASRAVLEEVFPLDASAEDLVPSELLAVSLNDFTKKALQNGAKPYAKISDRSPIVGLKTPKEDKQLRWKAYEKPVEPARHMISPTATMSTSNPSLPAYNPMMTNVTVTSASHSPGPSSPLATQRPESSVSLSLASLGGRGGPWTTSGFSKQPAAPPAYTQTTNSPAKNVTAISSNDLPPVSQPPSSMSSTISHLETNKNFASPDPKLDPKQARLASALFEGVDDYSSIATDTPKNKKLPPRRIGSGRIINPTSSPTTTMQTENLLLSDSDAPNSSSASNSLIQNDNSLITPNIMDSNVLTSNSHPPAIVPQQLRTAPPIPNPVMATSVDHLAIMVSDSPNNSESHLQFHNQSSSSTLVDLLGDFDSPPASSTSSSQTSGFGSSDILTFTSSPLDSTVNGGPARQLQPDRDNWNLSNLSKSPLLLPFTEYTMPSHTPLCIVSDPFLYISYLKAWTPRGVELAILFGNRTSLKIQAAKGTLASSEPISAVIEADGSVTVQPTSKYNADIAAQEIAPHTALIVVASLSIPNKFSLTMSFAGNFSFEVHGQTKNVKMRIQLDWRDFVRPKTLGLEKFGPLWTSSSMRESKASVASPTSIPSELSEILKEFNLSLVQIAKNEILCCGTLASSDSEQQGSTVLVHCRLDIATRNAEITIRSDSQSVAELGTRYIANALVPS